MKSRLTAMLLADARKVKKYSPDQPRDDHGRFGEGGGGESSSFKSKPISVSGAHLEGMAETRSNQANKASKAANTPHTHSLASHMHTEAATANRAAAKAVSGSKSQLYHNVADFHEVQSLVHSLAADTATAHSSTTHSHGALGPSGRRSSD
jgi:hypothetical protein